MIHIEKFVGGGDFDRILSAVAYLKSKKSEIKSIKVEINCTLLKNSFCRQKEFEEFWQDKVDAVNFNAEYYSTFKFRNIHYFPSERVDCKVQTYILPSGKIAPCCAMMVYAHDNDVSWLPDVRTHSLSDAHVYLSQLYEDTNSPLGKLCKNCDWWIMWAQKDGVSPYLRTVQFHSQDSGPRIQVSSRELRSQSGSVGHLKFSILIQRIKRRLRALFI